MTKEQLIELVKFTAGEIVAPTTLNNEDAESIVDDFVDTEQLTIPVVISRLKERLEINAGRLAEPLLKEGKKPKDDANCHKAFLMLAHLAEIEDYLNGL